MGAPIKERTPLKEYASPNAGPNLRRMVGWRERLNEITKHMTYREIAERSVLPGGQKIAFTTIRSALQGSGGIQMETLLAICDGLQIDASRIITGQPTVLALPPPGVATRSLESVVPLPIAPLSKAAEWVALAGNPETIESVYFAGEDDKDLMALRVEDDSMSPTFGIGDVVLATKGGKPKDGDTVVLSIGNNPSILRVWGHAKGAEKVTLKALNEDYGVLRQQLDRLKIHGIARKVAHSL